ncbi:hypothetical protein NSND_62768 [Nitrospira sp. ND1]|nr:hypothetical protein NSND_62768 [Nitrospira sp. ND1]
MFVPVHDSEGLAKKFLEGNVGQAPRENWKLRKWGMRAIGICSSHARSESRPDPSPLGLVERWTRAVWGPPRLSDLGRVEVRRSEGSQRWAVICPVDWSARLSRLP